MAPAIVGTIPTATSYTKGPGEYRESSSVASGPKYFDYETEVNGTATVPKMRYPNYLPTWDLGTKLPPIEPFEYIERGKDADPTFPDLLKGATVNGISGNTGAEVDGVQLSKLSLKGKDQLALFVAKKKVVVFRNQDFADLPIGDAVEFVKHFGKLHIHPTSPAPAGHPEVHIVHRSYGADVSQVFEERTSMVAWHTDTSYERQPPGVTFLYMLEGPSAGGDTIFSNQVEAYNRLSPTFKRLLHGLEALHTAGEQSALSAQNGGVVRREPVVSQHPIIRTHPATGEKALYVNPQFTRRIVGMKKEESDALLKFLFDHIAFGADFQARAKWAPGTVVVWDNRVACHTAITDWSDGQRRHIARITPQAEKPYETPFEDGPIRS